jgi:hypothetical protein
MKTLFVSLTLLSLVVSSLSRAATSSAPSDAELKLRGCLSLVYSSAAAYKGESKEVTKLVAAGTKTCKNEARLALKEERAVKRKAKLETQIKKLQAKLAEK